jgi:TonB family protein
LLKALPAEPYVLAEWRRCKVGIDYHVEAAKHFYSVPYRYARAQVEVRLTARTVEIFLKGERIASHMRGSGNGHHTTINDHMPSSHRRYGDWTVERLLDEAGKLGPVGQDAVRDDPERQATSRTRLARSSPHRMRRRQRRSPRPRCKQRQRRPRSPRPSRTRPETRETAGRGASWPGSNGSSATLRGPAAGAQGVATIRFRLDRQGHVLSSSIARSSGSKILDAEALATLARAEPLPAIPADRPDQIELLVPVEFFLLGGHQ